MSSFSTITFSFRVCCKFLGIARVVAHFYCHALANFVFWEKKSLKKKTLHMLCLRSQSSRSSVPSLTSFSYLEYSTFLFSARLL